MISVGKIGRFKLLTGLGLLLCVAIAILASIRRDDDRHALTPAVSQTEKEHSVSIHIFDQRRRELLFSKTSNGDLWFRDANGRERCLASNVVRASFSPDGKKFAYDTKNNEIFV